MRNTIITAIIALLLILAVTGCKDSSSTAIQAEKALHMTQLQDIYAILDGYPAMKSLFINNNLSKSTFEDKFFRGLLGNPQSANATIALCDVFPMLFAPREIPDGLFDDAMKREIESHGSMQDMMFVASGFFQALLALPEDQKSRVYQFMDSLAGQTGGPVINSPTVDHMLEMSSRFVRYLATRTDDSGQQDLMREFAGIMYSMQARENNDIDDIANDLRTFLYHGVQYLGTANNENMSANMKTIVDEMKLMKIPAEGSFDFGDIDYLITNYANNVPGWLFQTADLFKAPEVPVITRGMKSMLDREDTRTATALMMYNMGHFMRNPAVVPLVKDTVTKLGVNYTQPQLTEFFTRVWNDGPKIGPLVQGMDVEGYGKDGRQTANLRQLLRHPELISGILESIYLARKELNSVGLNLDYIDDGLVDVVTHDPLCQPLNNGETHYKPVTDKGVPIPFDFNNVSYMRGMCALASRYSQPLSPTSTFLYEKDGWITDDVMRNIIRLAMHDADKLPMSAFVWAEVYEKGEGHELGHGNVRSTIGENEYGMLLEGDTLEYDEATNNVKTVRKHKLIAPFFPELATGAEVAFYAGADCVYNGPYKYMYDNVNWLFTGRKLYLVIDLIQFLPQLKTAVSDLPTWTQWLFAALAHDGSISYGQWMCNVLKFCGFKKIPIILYEANGANQIIYTEAGQIFRDMPGKLLDGLAQSGGLAGRIFEGFDWLIDALMSLTSIDEWFANQIAQLMDVITPLGYKSYGSSKVYILPQDLRDLWTVLASIAFFDKDALHTDRLYTDSYAHWYDTRNHRFIMENGQVNPKINRVAPLAAAFCLGLYRPYKQLINQYPLSEIVTNNRNYFDIIRDRQAAARAQYDGNVFPIMYFINIFASLSEKNSETNTYAGSDQQMPFLRSIEPLLAAQPSGVMDNMMEMAAILGSPDMKDTRESMCGALASLAGRMPESAGGAAETVYAVIDGSRNDAAYFAGMEKAFSLGGKYLSPEYKIVDLAAGMLHPDHTLTAKSVEIAEYLNQASITQEDVNNATLWAVGFLNNAAEKKLFTRAMLNATDIVSSYGTKDPWAQLVTVAQFGCESDGVISYVLLGMEKSPAYSWEDIFSDTNRFLTSPLMTNYERGSFWSDLGFLANFMAQIF